jgi:hypothetical protein
MARFSNVLTSVSGLNLKSLLASIVALTTKGLEAGCRAKRNGNMPRVVLKHRHFRVGMLRLLTQRRGSASTAGISPTKPVSYRCRPSTSNWAFRHLAFIT